jgi:uncharacterized repeat protein (TIGR01451 family)
MSKSNISGPIGVAARSVLSIGLTLVSSTIVNSPIAQAAPRPVINNQASYEYSDEKARQRFTSLTSQLLTRPEALVDPLGRILGCNGSVLPDYSGFTVALYDLNPADPTGTELGNLLPLTPTEIPDIQNNGVPGGQQPNGENRNPFALSNAVSAAERGVYNFLFDPAKNQLQPGRSYILVVNPPPNSVYQQRRVKLQIKDSTGAIGNGVVRYLATSLDGQPVSATGDTTVEDTAAFVNNAETIGLDLLALQFSLRMCQPDQVAIVKSADRASSEPGDSSIYRLSIRNRADVALQQINVTDVLPIGFKLLQNSVRGEIDNQIVPITTSINGNTIGFSTTATIPPNRILNIAYATQITSEALRGTGRNSAVVNAERSDNRLKIKDGPANHLMRLRPGLLSDCGVLIGRVFDDRNFDGEQQPNEPGIPNAVVFLDDGNRITTDAKGMFSVSNVLPGARTGVLDLHSIPGYALAPNEKLRERRSQSRLVRLAPSGLARMNFAVTPLDKTVSVSPTLPSR